MGTLGDEKEKRTKNKPGAYRSHFNSLEARKSILLTSIKIHFHYHTISRSETGPMWANPELKQGGALASGEAIACFILKYDV